MTFYVYSTITNGTKYCLYDTSLPGPAVLKKYVEIKGGHGINAAHNPNQKNNFYTPRGMVTIVSDEDMEFLKGNEAFNRHIKGGFLSVDSKKISAEKKADDMAQKDGSAPLTPQDFEAGENSTKEQPTFKAKKGDFN
jgi:hypothetical protein